MSGTPYAPSALRMAKKNKQLINYLSLKIIKCRRSPLLSVRFIISEKSICSQESAQWAFSGDGLVFTE